VQGTSTYGGWSREIFLLINNIILVVSMAMILLGTLFPLIHEAIYGEANRVSVGPPYFNTIFVPLMALLAVFVGMSTFSRWKKTSVKHLKQQLWKVLVASVSLGILIPLVVTAEINMGAMLALVLALWITFSIATDLWQKTANKASRLAGLRSLGLSYWGMQIAHFGFAVIICGVCFTSNYSIEDDIRMEPGDTHSVGGYDFVFEGVAEREGPNFTADYATIRVMQDGAEYREMHPEKRRYHARGDVQTEADIDVGFFRDLFTALGDPRGDTAWVVRIHYKPFVFWIWFGAFLMSGGGVLAVLDRRYRRQRVKDAAAAAVLNAPLEAA
jgi:cytochrome c-type biogenesis protein CcmF